MSYRGSLEDHYYFHENDTVIKEDFIIIVIVFIWTKLKPQIITPLSALQRYVRLSQPSRITRTYTMTLELVPP